MLFVIKGILTLGLSIEGSYSLQFFGIEKFPNFEFRHFLNGQSMSRMF